MKQYLKYKILTFFLTFILVVSMIPSAVFGEELISLDGKLKLKGDAVSGTELCADYEEVLPAGMTDDQVKFLWMRSTSEAEEEAELNQTENLTRIELSKEKKYTLAPEDVGYVVILRIEGLEEWGYTGVLEAKTDIVEADEAEVLDELVVEEIPVEVLVEEIPVEEIPVEEIPVEEIPVEEIPEEVLAEEIPVEEIPEEVPVEEIPDEEIVEEEVLFEEVLSEELTEEVPTEEMEDVSSEEMIIEEIIVEEMVFNSDGTLAEESIEYALATDLSEDILDFGTFEKGSEVIPEEKTFAVTNIGNGEVTILLPEIEGVILKKAIEESADVLLPGETMEYAVTVNPSVMTEPNVYEKDVVLGDEATAQIHIKVRFEITETPDPTPTETPDPTPTETPDPTPTETPDPTPTETPDPTPTETPDPTPTETPDPTPTETPDPTPTETPDPTPTEKPEELITEIVVQPSAHNFGAVEAGYSSRPDAQYITIVNTGDTELNLKQPTANYYETGALSAAVLQPDETATFTVRPKADLEVGDYYETIVIETKEGVSDIVELEFAVTKKTVKLQGIEQPANITGIANGVKKTAEALKLPATVVISTTNGNMKANVNWDVESCDYSRKSVKEQTFTVKGKAVLPDGIKNPKEISLKVSVQVTVNAYTPKIADASNNLISGISSEKYTTQSKISFTAIGAGMDNENPRKGDVRYCPASWGVFNNNSWKSAPYTATFGMGQQGTYNLTVTFYKQQYDGENWSNTGEQDKKTVSFEVVQAEDGVSLTPVPEEREAEQKDAVETGDTTVILPLVIALIVALVCVIAVLAIRKRR